MNFTNDSQPKVLVIHPDHELKNVISAICDSFNKSPKAREKCHFHRDIPNFMHSSRLLIKTGSGKLSLGFDCLTQSSPANGVCPVVMET